MDHNINTMDYTFSFNGRYQINPSQWEFTQFDFKLLNRGKKIILNTTINHPFFTNRPLDPAKILFDDEIELSNSQLELIDKFLPVLVRLSMYDGSKDYISEKFCEIFNFLKKKDKDRVFTIDEYNYLKHKCDYEIRSLKEVNKDIINKLKEDNKNLEINNNKLEENNKNLEINNNKLKENNKNLEINNNKLEEDNKNLEINNNKLEENNKKNMIEHNKINNAYIKQLSEHDKKTKILLDKINRINNNILEKTLENNKLKLQLEDITDLYKLSLSLLKENNNDNLIINNDKLEENTKIIMIEHNKIYANLQAEHDKIYANLQTEHDKKTKILLDKINRINNNIQEKTLENNKLKLQLEDITDLYKLLLLIVLQFLIITIQLLFL